VSTAEVATWVLLVLSVAVQLISVTGVAAAREPLDRLHFAVPAAMLAPAPLAAAVLIADGFGQAGVKTLIVAALLALTAPVLSHATARATRVRELGEWRALLHEQDAPEQP
jgi:multicomponent Na+:H+ antiporter subunit G